MFDASGLITSGGTSQLLLPEAKSRAWLYIQNLSGTENLYLDAGSARATANMTSGVVTSCTITNGGFNFTYPPIVQFIGGGNAGQGGWLGVGQIGYPPPGDSMGLLLSTVNLQGQSVATGHAVLTNHVVTSIVVDFGGAGYQAAPFVLMTNDPRDPFGCADPHFNSANGFWGTKLLLPNTDFQSSTAACSTDPWSVYAVTTGHPFTCKYMI